MTLMDNKFSLLFSKWELRTLFYLYLHASKKNASLHQYNKIKNFKQLFEPMTEKKPYHNNKKVLSIID